MQIFDLIICVVFDNMFKIFKDPDENKPFLGLSISYNCDYLPHTTFRFYLTNFQLNTDFPSQFRFLQ